MRQPKIDTYTGIAIAAIAVSGFIMGIVVCVFM